MSIMEQTFTHQMDEDDLEDDLENKFKILLATDNHLGYNENHQIRDNDSFVTFEEILKIGMKEEVDFILLGGDLFHHCKPSTFAIQKCTELIKKYCLGDKPINIQFLSDPSQNFKQLKNPIVNYEDTNVNISIPIFSIHGNHDSPTGIKSISALDVLATSGLINYFGKNTDITQVVIEPVLLQKGTSKLAIYGLSHIHDQRLARLFREKKVSLKMVGKNWFQLMVVHQNRANRGANNFIDPSVLPDFIDLVVWGHEHDCKIMPELEKNIYVTQPGSSVATSLSFGESSKKHVGLLYIKDKSFGLKAIPLQTVRPFIFKTIEMVKAENIQEYGEDLPNYSMKKIISEIEEILETVKQERKEQKLKEMLPLIRIVVSYHSEQQQFNTIRFGAMFTDRVANPEDLILQKMITSTETRKKREKATEYDIQTEETDSTDMKDFIEKMFDTSNNIEKMTVLSVKGLGEALTRYIDMDDVDAFDYAVDHQIQSTCEKLMEMNVDVEQISEAIKFLQQKRDENPDGNVTSLRSFLSDPKRHKTTISEVEEIDLTDDFTSPKPSARGKKVEFKSDLDTSAPSTRGKKRGRGRGTKK